MSKNSLGSVVTPGSIEPHPTDPHQIMFPYPSVLGSPAPAKWAELAEKARARDVGTWVGGYAAACELAGGSWNERYQDAVAGGATADVITAFAADTLHLALAAASRVIQGGGADDGLTPVPDEERTFLHRPTGVVLHVPEAAATASRAVRHARAISACGHGLSTPLSAPLLSAATAIGLPVIAAAAVPLRPATRRSIAGPSPEARAIEAMTSAVLPPGSHLGPGTAIFDADDGRLYIVPSGDPLLPGDGLEPEAELRPGGVADEDATDAAIEAVGDTLRITAVHTLHAGAVPQQMHAHGVPIRRLGMLLDNMRRFYKRRRSTAGQLVPLEKPPEPPALVAVQAEILARAVKDIIAGEMAGVAEKGPDAVSTSLPAANRVFHHLCGGEHWAKLVGPLLLSKFGQRGHVPGPPSGELRRLAAVRLAAMIGAEVVKGRVTGFTPIVRGDGRPAPARTEAALKDMLEKEGRGGRQASLHDVLAHLAAGDGKIPHLRAAAELRRKAIPEAVSSEEPAAKYLTAQSLLRLARAPAVEEGESLRLREEACELLRAVAAAEEAGGCEQRALGSALTEHGGEQQLTEASALWGSHPPKTDADRSAAASTLGRLAGIYSDREDVSRAVDCAKRQVQLLDEGGKGLVSEAALASAELGRLLLELGKLPEAQSAFQKAADGLSGSQGDNHPDTAGALNNLACVDYALAKTASRKAKAAQGDQRKRLTEEMLERGGRAKATFTRLRKIPIEVWGDAGQNMQATTTNNLASVHFLLDEFEEAERLFAEAVSLYGDSPDARDPQRNLHNTRSRRRKEGAATKLQAEWRGYRSRRGVRMLRTLPRLLVADSGSCDGIYTAVRGETRNGHPIWTCTSDSLSSHICSEGGHWVVSAARPGGGGVGAGAFIYFRSADPHRRGMAPHAVRKWDAPPGAQQDRPVRVVSAAVLTLAAVEERARAECEAMEGRGGAAVEEEAQRALLETEVGAELGELNARAEAARRIQCAQRSKAARRRSTAQRLAAAPEEHPDRAPETLELLLALGAEKGEPMPAVATLAGMELPQEYFAAKSAAAAEKKKRQDAALKIQTLQRGRGARRQSKSMQASADADRTAAEQQRDLDSLFCLLQIGAELSVPTPALAAMAGLPVPDAGWPEPTAIEWRDAQADAAADEQPAAEEQPAAQQQPAAEEPPAPADGPSPPPAARATQFVEVDPWTGMRDPLAADGGGGVRGWLDEEQHARVGMLSRECAGRRTLLLRLAVAANRRRLADRDAPHHETPAVVCKWRPPQQKVLAKLKRLPGWARAPEAKEWIESAAG